MCVKNNGLIDVNQGIIMKALVENIKYRCSGNGLEISGIDI